MHKIASPTELQAELRSLVSFVQGHGPSGKPARRVVAARLRDLADRTAGGFSLEASGAAEGTFKKLRDGSWGLLVNSASVRPGDKVLTITKAGKRAYKVVGKVVWSGNGVAITTIDEGEEPRAAGGATSRQVDLAWNLVRKLVRSGGWFDSVFGDGMAPPTKDDLEGMSSREISQFIAELKAEF